MPTISESTFFDPQNGHGFSIMLSLSCALNSEHPSRFDLIATGENPLVPLLDPSTFPALQMQRDNTHRLHPRNSKLALTQFVGHLPAMADFLKELRKIQRSNEKAGVSLAVWADAAKVSHTTLWRILERGQTPSVSTYLALVKSADSMAEKKIASAQK